MFLQSPPEPQRSVTHTVTAFKSQLGVPAEVVAVTVLCFCFLTAQNIKYIKRHKSTITV